MTWLPKLTARAPDDIARLGFAVAHALDPQSPEVPDLPAEVRSLAERIAAALKGAKRPLIVSGPSLNSEAVIQAAANAARALTKAGQAAGLSFTTPEANSLGASLLGGGPLSEAFKAVEQGGADTVIILENDLYLRAPAAAVDRLLDAARRVIVIDQLETPTVAKAELALPAGTFAESDGTLVNNEGRAQRFFQAYVPKEDIQESWRWMLEVMRVAGRGEAEWNSLDDLVAAIAQGVPALEKITEAAPSAKFRKLGEKIPRSPHRYSGRTSMLANINVSEPKPPEDPDSALAFSMEGYPRSSSSVLDAVLLVAGLEFYSVAEQVPERDQWATARGRSRRAADGAFRVGQRFFFQLDSKIFCRPLRGVAAGSSLSHFRF